MAKEPKNETECKTESNVHAGHRQRMKERFLKNSNFDGYADHNILEMLLFFSIPRKDTNAEAHNLIKEFGSLERVLEAPYDELIKVDGISKSSACLIAMLLPLYRRYTQNCLNEKRTFTTMNEIVEYLISIYVGNSYEEVNMLCFDAKMHLIARTVISKGDINSSGFSTRKVVETAIKYNANSVILSHNHPHSIASPSKDDIETTKSVLKALNIIDVKLLDHIIIANNQYCSCLDSKHFDYRGN